MAKKYRPINKATAKLYIDTVQDFVGAYFLKNKKNKRYHLIYKANSLTTLANIEIDNENLDESIKIHLQAAKLYEELNIQKNIATSYNNIGAIFVMADKSDDAIFYLKKSLLIEEALYLKGEQDENTSLSITETMLNLGGIYSKIGKVDSAYFYYKKSLNYYEKVNDESGIAFCSNGIATTLRLSKKFNESFNYVKKAYTYYKIKKDWAQLAQSYIIYSDLYLDLKKFKLSILYADTAEQICKTNNFYDNLLYTYETKTMCYEPLNDNINYIKYFKKHTDLKDSLNNANNIIAIEELKTQYETQKKEKAISELQKDNKIKQLQLEKDATLKNRLILIVISVSAAVLILSWLAYFLSKIIKERKIAYIKLQEKNIEIQNQAELLNQQSKLISKYQSQMNPHFIFNALNTIKGLVIKKDSKKTEEQLNLLSLLMRQTLKNSDEDYIEIEEEINYLKNYVAFEQSKFTSPVNFIINFSYVNEGVVLPPMLIQPIIENSIKHAKLNLLNSPTITLTIEIKNELLCLNISDNGCGFNVPASDFFKPNHAVSILLKRLKVIFESNNISFKKDYFQINSQINNGTVVLFFTPLKYKF